MNPLADPQLWIRILIWMILFVIVSVIVGEMVRDLTPILFYPSPVKGATDVN